MRGIRKKLAFFPYDLDSFLGITNEGDLAFKAGLEYIDHLQGGANIWNGQDSVLYVNERLAFDEERAATYRTLRQTGAWSSGKIIKMFEDHQAKWPERLLNEDGRYKYEVPYLEGGNGAYLPDLLGPKKHQRKKLIFENIWYFDSKWLAGGALQSVFTIRAYDKANAVLTPYQDLYVTAKYGSYTVQQRTKRGVSKTLTCPVDALNDTEVYFYCAERLSSVGDLSGFKPGLVDASAAVKLRSLKIGDESLSFENPNLKTLTLGNNTLLQSIDARGSIALGTGSQKSVDLTGCENLEEAYFERTAVTGVSFPVGGIARIIHLPATITNLTLRNQKKITDLTVASYANVRALRLENNSAAVDSLDILMQIGAGANIRIIGFYWEVQNAEEIEEILDTLDTMQGIDIDGMGRDVSVNSCINTVSGTIHTESLTGEQVSSFNARYPHITISADMTTSFRRYHDEDGTLLKTVECHDGVPQSGPPTGMSKPNSADGHYSYTFAGWSKTQGSATPDDDALDNVIADRDLYAVYTATVRTYTVAWKSGTSTLRTDSNVAWGSTPTWGQAMPTKDGQTATGWDRDLSQPITGNTTITATYKPMYTATFVRASADGGGTLLTAQFEEGATVTYSGATPTSTQGTAEDYPFEGWSPALGPIYANTTYTAKFGSPVQDVEITDSWDTIIANIDNGTYKTVYKLGNYKPLDLGTEGTVNMQIVAMDEDDLASGGKAPLTFIARNELLATTKIMNIDSSSPYTTGGWEDAGLRSYLNNDIYRLIPQNVSSRINQVKKISTTYDRSARVPNGATTFDKIWIPSGHELFSDITTLETVGATYYKVFKNDSDRIRTYGFITRAWWLRSVRDATTYMAVTTNGNIAYQNASDTPIHICIGFCLGLETETITDSWSEIFAAEQDGTYSTKYAIGDTKSIDLGTEGAHLMKIVAFDTDDKADGSGKAKITWISKDLLPTTHVMNSTATSAGGWESSEMRTYLKNTIKPLIPETVRNAIVPVTKIQSIYTTQVVKDGQTTTDDVWIPSSHETFGRLDHETTEVTYYNSIGKIRKSNGSVKAWWTRSAASSSSFCFVSTGGIENTASANTNEFHIALGFCT